MNTRKKELKSTIRDWIPPALVSLYKSVRKKGTRYEGDYASWQEAYEKSTGYDSAAILEKVSASLLKVKSGEAAFERDSVLFDSIEYPFPLLAILLRVANANGSRLCVLDFGGSLGSTYFQCREFLPELRELKWCVVEQPGFVERGRALFESEDLKFYFTIGECLSSMKPDIVLLGSVLQYLPQPYSLLDEINHAGIRYLVLDRTPMAESIKDRLCVQVVSPEIYSASYPCMVFSEGKLKEYLSEHYRIIAEYSGKDENAWYTFKYKGLICRLAGLSGCAVIFKWLLALAESCTVPSLEIF